MKLCDAISIGNTDLAKSILKQINQKDRAKLASSPIRSNQNSVIASITLFTRAAITAGVTDEEAYGLSDRFINELELCETMVDINRIEYDALQEMTKQVNVFLNNHYSRNIIEAMQAIKSNLKNRISLSVVASMVNVTPSYLSEQFKRETGKTISQYIMEEKVKESVFFLKNTSLSIAEIADLYGFANSSYYSKHFRQIFSLTPSGFKIQKP